MNEAKVIFKIRKANTRWTIYNRYGKQEPPFDSFSFYFYSWSPTFEGAIRVVDEALRMRGRYSLPSPEQK